MMLISLVKLLKCWDSGQLPSLPQDLVHNQIPLVLFQISIRTLEKQSSDGSWGLIFPSREITAYAVLTLKVLSSLPWLAHFRSCISKAVRQGSIFLIMSHDNWNCLEHIWVEKVTYALPPLSRTYCIAALCAETSFKWSESVASLGIMSSEKIIKLARFFSQLPMFSEDERWRLEADVAAGMFFLQRLISVSSAIFPRQEHIHYKYLEYIPFSWIATNRRNGGLLPNVILWETMMISLLDY